MSDLLHQSFINLVRFYGNELLLVLAGVSIGQILTQNTRRRLRKHGVLRRAVGSSGGARSMVSEEAIEVLKKEGFDVP